MTIELKFTGTGLEPVNDKARNCGQTDCQRPAKYLYIWPGRGLMPGCEVHAMKAQNICELLGFPLQLIPLERIDL